MIQFSCFVKRKIDKFAIISAESVAEVRAQACLEMRKLIGKNIKRWVPFGIRPIGKLVHKFVLEMEDYDCECHWMIVSVEGTFSQILCAYRAGLKIERDLESVHFMAKWRREHKDKGGK